MAVVKDWVWEAALLIFRFPGAGISEIEEIIDRSCPFKRGVAYEEVKPQQEQTNAGKDQETT